MRPRVPPVIVAALLAAAVCHGAGRRHKNCLDAPFQQSLLQRLMRSIRLSAAADVGGQSLVILEKQWPTHQLSTAITRTLIREVLGHDVVVKQWPATFGSYELIANGQADLDMELWATSSAEEYDRFHTSANRRGANAKYIVHAGNTFDHGRSGLFMRPGTGHEHELLTDGRMYSYANTTLVPKLPTMAEAQSLCDPTLEHDPCQEMPNRICHDQECRAVLKVNDVYDKTLVEKMIRCSSLPLGIVYIGWSLEQVLKTYNKSQSLLFYWWEPDAYITPDIIRLNFDAPDLCDYGSTTSKLPSNLACDFKNGGVHKGFGKRVEKLYPDVRHLVESYTIQAATILTWRRQTSAGGTGALLPI